MVRGLQTPRQRTLLQALRLFGQRPNLCFIQWKRYSDPVAREHMAEGLCKAGVPEQ
jgi:hypothetical protein